MTAKEIIEKFKQDNPDSPIGSEGSYCDEHRAGIIVSTVPVYLFEASLVQKIIQKVGEDKFFDKGSKPKGCYCCLVTTEELNAIFKEATNLMATSLAYDGNATTNNFALFTTDSPPNEEDLS